jgi:hypothetical protein
MTTSSLNPGEYLWALITSKTLPSTRFESKEPPLIDPPDNEFANASPDDVLGFILHNIEGFKALGYEEVVRWVILDAEGIETSTCLLAQRIFRYDEATKTGCYTDKQRFVRLPLELAWSMFANLDIGNMGFEDFATLHDAPEGHEELPEPRDGEYELEETFKKSDGSSGMLNKDALRKREAALKTLRDLGHIAQDGIEYSTSKGMLVG